MIGNGLFGKHLFSKYLFSKQRVVYINMLGVCRGSTQRTRLGFCIGVGANTHLSVYEQILNWAKQINK